MNSTEIGSSPRPRPERSETACQTWSAAKPRLCAALGRSGCSADASRATTSTGRFPAVESGSPNWGSPGRRSRSMSIAATSDGVLSTLLARSRARRTGLSSCSAMWRKAIACVEAAKKAWRLRWA